MPPKRKHKEDVVAPKSTNPHITNIAALKRKPMEQEALNILYEIANAVGPLMKHYGFKVGLLSEMSPKNPSLLGLNVNRGHKIYLRLRPHGNDTWFLPMESLMGTMLHELTHNVFGPHDVKFYKKLDELSDKLNELKIEGVKFGGDGFRLGGRRGLDERKSRERKLRLYQGGTRKLGGDGHLQGSLRDMVRQAAVKRYEDAKWCNSGQKGDLPEDDELDIVEVSEEEFKRSRRKPEHKDDSEGRDKEGRDKEGVVEVVDLTI
jgi:hypothetical protein